MDQNWFFKWIWRFNALVIAGLLTTLIVSLVRPYVPMQYGGTAPEPYPTAETQPVAPPLPPISTSLPRYSMRLDQPRPGAKVGVFALELGTEVPTYSSERNPPYPSSSVYSGGRVVDYLIVEPGGATRWLFPTHDQVILSTEYVTASSVYPQYYTLSTEPLTAVLYHVIPGDPKKFDSAPKTQTYASTPDGSKLVKLLDNLDQAPITTPLSADQILVYGRVGGRMKATIFSLGDFKQLAQKDITEVTPK